MSDYKLKVTEHSRDIAGLRYVYPVISRRAGGVSVGINLNTNNACNWRCIYCQVPELKLGTAPTVDLVLMEQELRGFLDELLNADFMLTHVPEGARRINDIALSGNGEPTSAADFANVVEIIGKVKNELALTEPLKLILITNGSFMYRENVQQGIRFLANLNGEVWFKLDRANAQDMLIINDTHTSLDKVRQNLSHAVSCCPNTWIQTCWFELDGLAPTQQEQDDYLKFLQDIIQRGVRPRGVLLYGIARASLQPEAPRLKALPLDILEQFAGRIRELSLTVKVQE